MDLDRQFKAYLATLDLPQLERGELAELALVARAAKAGLVKVRLSQHRKADTVAVEVTFSTHPGRT